MILLYDYTKTWKKKLFFINIVLSMFFYSFLNKIYKKAIHFYFRVMVTLMFYACLYVAKILPYLIKKKNTEWNTEKMRFGEKQ